MQNFSGLYIGRYHILEPLGEGGMAVVYKAYDTNLERDVAVKFIRTGEIGPNHLTEVLKRFEREAKALAKFDHPNIITVFEYGNFEDVPYLVMQYQPGGSLNEVTTAGSPFDCQKAVEIIHKISGALIYSHKRNIIHRDIKPSNILITDEGEPKLTDFGIAKILDVSQNTVLTQTGVGIGTPEYMAPEQFMGGKIDGRTDVYALGIVLYELITGRRPYQADTPAAVLIKQSTEPLPVPSKFNPLIGEVLEKTILKALSKDPAHRFQTMQEFSTALQKLLDEKDGLTRESREEKTELDISDSIECISRPDFPFERSTGDDTLIDDDVQIEDQIIYQDPGFHPDSVNENGLQVEEFETTPQKGNRFPWVIMGLILAGICLLASMGIIWYWGDSVLEMFAPDESTSGESNLNPVEDDILVSIQATQTALAVNEQDEEQQVTHTPAPSYTSYPTYTPFPTSTREATHTIQTGRDSASTLTPTRTVEMRPTETPYLILDMNYFCRDGPATSYRDRIDYYNGTKLPIIGKDDTHWWLVEMESEKTRAKCCWIGGGTVVGDSASIPYVGPPYPLDCAGYSQ